LGHFFIWKSLTVCPTPASIVGVIPVIAREGKQSQPLELLHFTSFPMANATQRLRNNTV